MTPTERLLSSTRIGLWVWVAVLGVSVCLAPLLSSQYYLLPGGVLAGAVVVTGIGMRTAGLRWPLVVVGQVVVLAELVTLGYARDGATLGVVPDRDTLQALQALARATFAHAQQFPAPVPPLPAMDAVIASGMGALAVVVDVLAVSRRTIPLVGLVFLAVYMTPVSLLNGDVTMWAFIPGALGFVFLLSSAERVYALRWGHHLADLDRNTSGPTVSERGRGLLVTGRRVGFGAVACAVIVPLLVPTLSPRLLDRNGPGSGTSPGSRSVAVNNPILDMRRNLTHQSDATLVRVTDTMRPPSYLRLTALTALTSDGWGLASHDHHTASADGLFPDPRGRGLDVAQTIVSGTVKLSKNFRTRWLPVPYAPRGVTVNGAWRVDRSTLAVMAGTERTDGAGITYSYTSAVAEPTPRQLRSAKRTDQQRSDLVQLPQATPEVIRRRAFEVTQGTTDPFDAALALQRWFRTGGGFTYDLTPQIDGDAMSSIARFVSDDRRGYCEQFATAMAMMARAVGIPSRVAIGFLRPERDGNAWVFRGTDMHAWPELYFRGVGWVRFEPTPGGAGYDAATFDAPQVAPGPQRSLPSQGSTQTPEPRSGKKTVAPVVLGSSEDGGGPPGWLAGAAIGLVALLVLLAVPSLVRLELTRRRWRSAPSGPRRAEAAWAELRARVRDLGEPWDATATPRSVGRTLRGRLAGDAHAEEALDLVVRQIERARYDRDCDATGMREAVETVRRRLAERASRPRRLLARVFPTAWTRRGGDDRHVSASDSALIALRD